MNATEAKQPNQTETSRVIMLGVFSVFLSISFFMSIFAPYPLGLSSVMYGRAKGLMTIGVATGLCFILASFVFKDFTIIYFFALSIPVSIGLVDILERGMNPVKGILYVGSGITLFLVLIISFFTTSVNKGLPELVEEQFKQMEPILEEYKKQVQVSNAENSLELEAMFSQPKLMAETFLKSAPAYFVAGVFLMLWVNLFLLLKTRRLTKSDKSFKYDELYLLNFKMPEFFIWFVIAFLALIGFGENLGTWFPTVGVTGLATIGVFYFFQGFGIYLAFLDRIKLRGFFRSILVVITILTAYQIIAVIGLADMFVDFKKLMNKNELGE